MPQAQGRVRGIASLIVISHWNPPAKPNTPQYNVQIPLPPSLFDLTERQSCNPGRKTTTTTTTMMIKLGSKALLAACLLGVLDRVSADGGSVCTFCCSCNLCRTFKLVWCFGQIPCCCQAMNRPILPCFSFLTALFFLFHVSLPQLDFDDSRNHNRLLPTSNIQLLEGIRASAVTTLLDT